MTDIELHKPNFIHGSDHRAAEFLRRMFVLKISLCKTRHIQTERLEDTDGE